LGLRGPDFPGGEGCCPAIGVRGEVLSLPSAAKERARFSDNKEKGGSGKKRERVYRKPKDRLASFQKSGEEGSALSKKKIALPTNKKRGATYPTAC